MKLYRLANARAEFLPEDIRYLSIDFLQLFYPLLSMSGTLSHTQLGPILFRIALIDIFLEILDARRRKKTSTLYVKLEGKNSMLSLSGEDVDFMIDYIEKRLQEINDFLTSSSLKLDERMCLKLDKQARTLERYKYSIAGLASDTL